MIRRREISGRRMQERYLGDHIMKSLETYSAEGTPCAFISGEERLLGVVTNCNQAFARTFGYSQKELLRKNVGALLPDLYATFQHRLLSHYTKFPDKYPDIRRTELSIFGRLKSRYILPIRVKIAEIPSFLNGFNFILLLYPERKINNLKLGYLLLNLDLGVVGISTSCINLLNLTISSIQFHQFNLTGLIPQFLQFKKYIHQATHLHWKGFYKKGGKLTQVVIPEKLLDFANSAARKPDIQYLSNRSETGESEPFSKKECFMHVQIANIEQELIGLIGYVIKLDNSVNTSKIISGSSLYSDKVSQAPTNFRFQFRYDQYFHKFVREITEIITDSPPQDVSQFTKFNDLKSIKNSEKADKSNYSMFKYIYISIYIRYIYIYILGNELINRNTNLGKEMSDVIKMDEQNKKEITRRNEYDIEESAPYKGRLRMEEYMNNKELITYYFSLIKGSGSFFDALEPKIRNLERLARVAIERPKRVIAISIIKEFIGLFSRDFPDYSKDVQLLRWTPHNTTIELKSFVLVKKEALLFLSNQGTTILISAKCNNLLESGRELIEIEETEENNQRNDRKRQMFGEKRIKGRKSLENSLGKGIKSKNISSVVYISYIYAIFILAFTLTEYVLTAQLYDLLHVHIHHIVGSQHIILAQQQAFYLARELTLLQLYIYIYIYN